MKKENFIQHIEEIKKHSELDLSVGEDLSIALMNLISLEEHFLFSFLKTQNEKFLEFLEKTREIRKKYLEKIVKKDDESEKWCISKHLLATSMRLIEVGTKFLHSGKEKEAQDTFNEAFELYSMFWVVNNEKVFNLDKISNSKLSKLSQMVKKLLDCCKE